MRLPFANRADAGAQLVHALLHLRGRQPLVLAIPRGGVPLGRIVADALGGDLDVVLVRKIGAPGHAEFAVGAVDEQGTVLLNADAAEAGADPAYVHAEAARQLALIRERRQRYGKGLGSDAATKRTVIVVDDGLATGATMLAALRAVRRQRPAWLVCALPVASAEGLAEIRTVVDELVCLATPAPFHAVGLYYRDFAAVEEDAVCTALHGAAAGPDRPRAPPPRIRS